MARAIWKVNDLQRYADNLIVIYTRDFSDVCQIHVNLTTTTSHAMLKLNEREKKK